jgi:ATP-binding cassette, subfamily B, bacterial
VRAEGSITIRDQRQPQPGYKICRSGGRVALREVYFRYPGAPVDALAGVSLQAGPSQLVALVGPSGAGKTTISCLIPRLYDVTGGSVQIDGADVRHVHQASLTAAIGS